MRRRLLTLTVALLAGVAGCSDDGAAQQPSQTPTATTPTPTVDRRFECAGLRIPNPAAPPFTGRGPHLAIAGIHLRTAVPDGVAPDDFSTYNLPQNWRASDRKRPRQDDPSRAQLVICLTGMRLRGSEPIHKCESGAFEVYPVTYRFDVYEARTGRRLGATAVASDATPRSSCPVSWTFRPNGAPDPEPAQGVSEETVTATFKPFVIDGKGMRR